MSYFYSMPELHKKYLLPAACLLAALLLLEYCSTSVHQTDTEKAMLGHYLFFDNRLSYNNTKSCASCHDPAFAFTDGYRRSITASGDHVLHNAPSLLNIAQHRYFDLANPSITTLEQQHERPLFSTSPTELGARGNEAAILSRLKQDSMYRRLFAAAFPDQADPVSFTSIIRAVAAYVRTLRSASSPYDRYISGDSSAMKADAVQGMQLFFSARLNCSACHSGTLFTAAAGTSNTDSIYFNTGLYNVGNSNRYPPGDNGLAAAGGRPQDDGRFKTPSLRNAALTAPYMHDGSVSNLAEVIDLYARGGRLITDGPLAGDGALNSCRSSLIKPFSISPREKQQLLAFLHALTDSSVFSNPSFKNPFTPSFK